MNELAPNTIEVHSLVTLRISGVAFDRPPEVKQEFRQVPGGYSAHNQIEGIVVDGDDWLLTMQLAPRRTVHLS